MTDRSLTLTWVGLILTLCEVLMVSMLQIDQSIMFNEQGWELVESVNVRNQWGHRPCASRYRSDGTYRQPKGCEKSGTST